MKERFHGDTIDFVNDKIKEIVTQEKQNINMNVYNRMKHAMDILEKEIEGVEYHSGGYSYDKNHNGMAIIYICDPIIVYPNSEFYNALKFADAFGFEEVDEKIAVALFFRDMFIGGMFE